MKSSNEKGVRERERECVCGWERERDTFNSRERWMMETSTVKEKRPIFWPFSNFDFLVALPTIHFKLFLGLEVKTISIFFETRRFFFKGNHRPGGSFIYWAELNNWINWQTVKLPPWLATFPDLWCVPSLNLNQVFAQHCLEFYGLWWWLLKLKSHSTLALPLPHSFEVKICQIEVEEKTSNAWHVVFVTSVNLVVNVASLFC